ncbi:energy-coupling factor ABC transporter ATP-binding protein [Leptothermofonsia sp. ETS-13]|uniref:energy-coupling factor ABC transporter ATP-binding protein n=1 Tax=Leptothermofonsia sp. ETS-13 TaxID=3035696 RepID=UPI003BA3C8C3
MTLMNPLLERELPIAMVEAAIAVTDLEFSYSDCPDVLRAVNLRIHSGERVAVIGANGCGKTTLFRLLCGVLAPTAGRIALFGESVLPGNFRPDVGLVFQNPDDQLFSPSVWEDVAFGPQNMGLLPDEVDERVSIALALTQVQGLAHRPPHHLSGGEKKRVAIASVLAMNPQILLLDEPSVQLDPRSRRQLIHLLDQLPLTQLIATHDLDLALELCDRTIVLSQGQIVYDGPTETILSDSEQLEQYALELPLSYSRPYCRMDDAPVI